MGGCIHPENASGAPGLDFEHPISWSIKAYNIIIIILKCDVIYTFPVYV